MANGPIQYINFSDAEGEVFQAPPARPIQRVEFSDSESEIIVGRPPRRGTGKPPESIPTFTGGAWDILIVAKRPMPGITQVEGVGHEKRTHQSESAGVNGARVTETGQKSKKISVTTRIWTDQHYADLLRMLRIIFPRKKLATDYEKVLKSDERWGRYYEYNDAVINVPNLPTNSVFDTGLLIDFDTQLNRSPIRTYNEARAERGEGIYVPIYFGELVDSPLMTLEEARARTEAEQAKLDAQLAKPLDVEHPALRMFGIGTLHFLKASLLTATSTPGVFEIKFECVDQVAQSNAKAVVGTAKGSNSGWDKIVSAIEPSSPASLGGKP